MRGVIKGVIYHCKSDGTESKLRRSRLQFMASYQKLIIDEGGKLYYTNSYKAYSRENALGICFLFLHYKYAFAYLCEAVKISDDSICNDI